MGDIIRRGKLIMDIVAGKTDLQAPDIKELLESQEKAVELQKQLNAATEQAKVSQEALSQSTQAYRQVQGSSIARSFEQSQALQKVAGGSLQVTRALVLMGASSEESMGKIVRDLAAVQAGIDLFKGSTTIMRGLAGAMGLAAAEAATLMAVVNPLIGASALLGAGMLLWKTRPAEAADEEERLTAAVRERAKAMSDVADAARTRLERSREALVEENRRGMSDSKLYGSLAKEKKQVDDALNVYKGQLGGVVPQNENQRAALETAKAEYNELLTRSRALGREMGEVQERQMHETQQRFGDFLDGIGKMIGAASSRLTGQEKKTSMLEMAMQAMKAR